MKSLALTTDYATSRGDATPYLRRIAATGFTHVHWCHEWNTDYEYKPAEIDLLQKCFTECGLKLLDLHGSAGHKRRWFAPEETERRAGVALVQNRIKMTARLGGQSVVMHAHSDFLDPLRRSLDELQPFARQRGIRIAIENTEETNHFTTPRQLLSEYPPEFLGLCYDSGHGNMANRHGLDELETLTDRLIALHLHDNDGTGDQHKLMFTGTVDWPRLAKLIAQSSYRDCVSSESNNHNNGLTDETEFLAQAFAAGHRFAAMITAS